MSRHPEVFASLVLHAVFCVWSGSWFACLVAWPLHGALVADDLRRKQRERDEEGVADPRCVPTVSRGFED